MQFVSPLSTRLPLDKKYHKIQCTKEKSSRFKNKFRVPISCFPRYWSNTERAVSFSILLVKNSFSFNIKWWFLLKISKQRNSVQRGLHHHHRLWKKIRWNFHLHLLLRNVCTKGNIIDTILFSFEIRRIILTVFLDGYRFWDSPSKSCDLVFQTI